MQSKVTSAVHRKLPISEMKWIRTRALFASFMTSRIHSPQLLVRVQNTIPYVSETYQCCLNGEVGLLKKRFDNGLASPFDVDPEGVSLVHVSFDYIDLSRARR
jgi:hypothetical protein